MSSLTLCELRVLLPGAGVTYGTATAEWFKTWDGNPYQYRMTWRADGLWNPSARRYYSSADDAVAAAFRCARRMSRGER